MKAATLSELRQELKNLPEKNLVELCLALAKYKKDNKDYLSYLLLESTDRRGYVKELRTEMAASFAEIDAKANLYYTKKTLRKILRQVNRFSRFINEAPITCELLILYCRLLQESGIPFQKSQQLVNLYAQQIKKIEKLISSLHEDLQSDYLQDLKALEDEF